VSVSARHFLYQRKLQKITASGNVQVYYQGRLLKCHSLCLWLRNNTATAKGNVQIIEKDMTLNADHIALKKDLSEGLIEKFRIIFKEHGILSGDLMKRQASGKNLLKNGSFTSCDLDHPTWTLTADEIIHDEEKKDIELKYVSFYFKGKKIITLPFSIHYPDPRVQYKNGFLAPSFGRNTENGYFMTTPYYINFSPYHDMVITPFLLTKETPMIVFDHTLRHPRFDVTSFLKSNIVKSSNREKQKRSYQYYLTSKGSVDVSHSTLLIFDVNRASTMDYVNGYDYNENQIFYQKTSILPTHFKLIHFLDDGLITMDTLYSKTFDTSKSAQVYPSLSFFHQKDFFDIQGQLVWMKREESFFDQCFQVTRPKKIGRFSIRPVINYPHVTSHGAFIETSIGCDSTYYYLNNYQSFNHYSFAPFFHQTISYPMLKEGFIIEPTLIIHAQKQLKKTSSLVINEDYLFHDLDEHNLLSHNRLYGKDKVDSGVRTIMGVNVLYRYMGLFLGKTIPIKSHQYIDKLYVSRMFVDISSHIKIYIKSLWSPSFKLNLNETGFSFKQKRMTLDMSHVYTIPDLNEKKITTSQLNGIIKTRLSHNWQISYAQIYNLKKQDKKADLHHFFGFEYNDDDSCFKVQGGIFKSSQNENYSGFLLKFSLKSIGDIQTFNTPHYPSPPLANNLNF
jgi:LPS-assembly protein